MTRGVNRGKPAVDAKIDARLAANRKPEHIVTDTGDCRSWCEACRIERAERDAKRKTEAPKTGPNLPVWAWKVKGGTGLWHIGFGPAPSSGVDSFEYVPANPRADAVVKAAKAWKERHSIANNTALILALEALESGT